jgi:general secretion pathway protein K
MKSLTVNWRAQGLALVIVLWILTLLTLMAGSFAKTMRRETAVSTAIKINAQAQSLAESGITLAQFMLNQPPQQGRWRGDGTVYRLLRPEGEMRIRILSESGKVDINSGTELQLAAVLNSVIDETRQQESVLNAILDWRDADDDTRTHGAEKTQYRRKGLKYGPSNFAFQSLEELQLVLGMNEAIFSRIEPWITIYSGTGEVNLDLASPDLLSVIASEMKRRNISDDVIRQKLQSVGNKEDEMSATDETITSEEQTYTIISQVLLNREAAGGLQAVIRSQADNADQLPFTILDWKQITQGLSLFDNTMDYRIVTVEDESQYNDRP